jgi:hypothetical protein
MMIAKIRSDLQCMHILLTLDLMKTIDKVEKKIK